MLSQRPLKLLSLQKRFFFFLFSLDEFHYSFSLLIHFSASSVYSTIDSFYCTFYCSNCIFSLCVVLLYVFSVFNSLLKFSLCLSILLLSLLRIFMIITLNHLSSRLIPSVLVSSFSEVLSVPSLFGGTFLYLFIFLILCIYFCVLRETVMFPSPGEEI